MFKGPNVTSRQGQRSGTTFDKQIPFMKLASNLEPKETLLFACKWKQLQRLTGRGHAHCVALHKILSLTNKQ